MKKLLIFLAAVALHTSAYAQTTAWTRHFSHTNTIPGHTLYSIQVRPDGYSFLAYASDNIEMYQIHVGFDGQPIDTVVIGSVPSDVVLSSDGGFFKGYMEVQNVRLKKLDASGHLLWEKVLQDTLVGSFLRLAPLPDGGCYVVCVTANGNASSPVYTIVRRIAADGTVLWQRHTDQLTTWIAQIGRWITDVVAMPDSSCLVLTSDNWDGYHGGGHIFQIKPDGSDGYKIGHNFLNTYAYGGVYQLAQPAADGSLLAMGFKWGSSTGGHPGSTSIAFSIRLTEQANGGVKTQVFEYPATYSQKQTTYGVSPYAMAPMTNGEMVVIEQQYQDIRLRRSSWDLKDSVWERPLTPAVLVATLGRIERPNRILYGTPDGGAIIGGVDLDGIFLMKLGQWGEDTATIYQTVAGHVLEDNDFDCQTVGPYLPAVNTRVRFTSVAQPDHRWWVKPDAAGAVEAQLPQGLWRAEVADTVEVIYGKSCVQDILLTVTDTLATPEFQLPVLRYKARLSGRAGYDSNANCLLDDGILNGQKLRLHKDGHDYLVTPDLTGYFSVAVDTGRYQLQIQSYEPGMFSGYYCQSTEAYLPDFYSTDSVTVLFSRLQNCRMQVNTRRDVDYNCTPANGEENWDKVPVLLKDAATGQELVYVSYAGYVEKDIYGPGDLQVSFLPDFGDSLICTPGLPDTINFHFAENNQLYTDTLVGMRPRLQDTLIGCAGTWAYNQILLTQDTVLTTVENYVGNYLPVQVTHHIYVLPSWHITQTIVDTTLTADSLQIFYYKAVNGCDSIVRVYYVPTSGTKEATARPLMIAPNPTTGRVTVQFPEPDISRLQVLDVSGRILRTFHVSPGLQQYGFSLEGLPSGVYMVKALRENGRWLLGKVIFQVF